MKKIRIFANWKMNKTLANAEIFIKQLVSYYQETPNIRIAVCAPYPYLGFLSQWCKGSIVGIGAENMHAKETGSFTGEVSSIMLREVGCTYVLLGHSERRLFCHESDQDVNQKILAAIEHRLIPIVCVGETLEEREAGRTNKVLERQLQACLHDVTPDQEVWVAYEPRWAIGTGITPAYEEIEQTHTLIRRIIDQHCGKETCDGIQILYGGSVNAANSYDICKLEHVNGLGYGECSLDYKCFTHGIENARKAAAIK